MSKCADTKPQRALGASLGWLIDGQQRVLTLAMCRAGDEDIDVAFNVETEAFSRTNAATRKDDRWLRVADVWDDEWFFRFRRNLPEDVRGRRTEHRLECLRAILDYEVPDSQNGWLQLHGCRERVHPHQFVRRAARGRKIFRARESRRNTRDLFERS